jgi:hypothetical protein
MAAKRKRNGRKKAQKTQKMNERLTLLAKRDSFDIRRIWKV